MKTPIGKCSSTGWKWPMKRMMSGIFAASGLPATKGMEINPIATRVPKLVIAQGFLWRVEEESCSAMNFPDYAGRHPDLPVQSEISETIVDRGSCDSQSSIHPI